MGEMYKYNEEFGCPEYIKYDEYSNFDQEMKYAWENPLEVYDNCFRFSVEKTNNVIKEMMEKFPVLKVFYREPSKYDDIITINLQNLAEEILDERKLINKESYSAAAEEYKKIIQLLITEEELRNANDNSGFFNDQHWEDVQNSLEEMMNKCFEVRNGYNGTKCWIVEGRNINWRGSGGNGEFEADTAREIIKKITPNSDFSFNTSLVKNDDGYFHLEFTVYHHDCPTGSHWILEPAVWCDCGDNIISLKEIKCEKCLREEQGTLEENEEE